MSASGPWYKDFPRHVAFIIECRCSQSKMTFCTGSGISSRSWGVLLQFLSKSREIEWETDRFRLKLAGKSRSQGRAQSRRRHTKKLNTTTYQTPTTDPLTDSSTLTKNYLTTARAHIKRSTIQLAALQRFCINEFRMTRKHILHFFTFLAFTWPNPFKNRNWYRDKRHVSLVYVAD